MSMENDKYLYTPLPEPVSIMEQEWPVGTMPLVYTRTMTYNHKDYIRECIEGLLMQKTTFPVRVLIHDDASTDGTAEIVREYEQKYPRLIKAYYQKENSHTKPDKFERRATFGTWRIGKYEAICEGDDYWHNPLKLQKQVGFLEAHSDFSMCHSEADYKDMVKGRFVQNDHASAGRRHDQANVAEAHVCGDYVVRTCTIVARNEWIKKIAGEHRDEFRRFIAGDMILVFHLSRMGRVYYIEESLATYRRVPGSLTGMEDVSRRLKFIFAASEERLYFCQQYDLSSACLNRVLDTDLKVLLELCYKCRDKNSLRRVRKIFGVYQLFGINRFLYWSTMNYWIGFCGWFGYRVFAKLKRGCNVGR